MLLGALINILGHDNRGTGSLIDGSIWRKRRTRPPKNESNEVEKRGSLSKGLTRKGCIRR